MQMMKWIEQAARLSDVAEVKHAEELPTFLTDNDPEVRERASERLKELNMELKTRNGWITCPKDKVVHLIDLHCSQPITKCPHFKGKGPPLGDLRCIVYCSYEEGEEE